MDSALEILAFLVITSGSIFVVVGLLVLVFSGRKHRKKDGVVWIGGPYETEHGAGQTTRVLTGVVPRGEPPDVDWPAMAATTEPGRHIGGASAGW
ncbi:hypothetical protein Acor_18930 [Acrocarpospora corrugata]|uniref:Uncharacterized protein n=1 Tax=Acrocarpospora corrugata TaxID=35763 RepID=A0A5M3VV79_9ACTN|nr:hypothetical protein [Acrocarpospora corrugata]GER99829.1 hypothetical protein Acor_18930 [Acrocarpospora corrugata]